MSGRSTPSRSTAALEAGDYRKANQLIERMLDFEEIRAEEQNGTNVTAVKAALQLIGDDCGRPGRLRHGHSPELKWTGCANCWQSGIWVR